MEKFLIDTSAWIAGFQKKGSPLLKEFLTEKLVQGEVVTTGVVLLELLRGTKDESSYKLIRSRFEPVPVIKFDESFWEESARLSFYLRGKGVQVSVPDVLISTVALQEGCTVGHCDRDYEMIAKHTHLKTLCFL